MANADGHGFGTTDCTQLSQDCRHVKLHSVFGNAHPRSNFLIGETQGKHAQNFLFAWSQRLEEFLNFIRWERGR